MTTKWRSFRSGKVKSGTWSQKNPIHIIVDVTTFLRTGCFRKNKMCILKLIQEKSILSQIVAHIQWGCCLALKFMLWLVTIRVNNLLTPSKIPKYRFWPSFAPTARVLMDEFFFYRSSFEGSPCAGVMAKVLDCNIEVSSNSTPVISFIFRPIGLMSIVFANSPGDWEFNPRSSHTKDSKMALDAALLNTQHYKVRINGKVEQSREWSSAPPLYHGVVAIEKGASESPSMKVVNFIAPSYGLNSTTVVDVFGIKYPMNFDMLLNKETKIYNCHKSSRRTTNFSTFFSKNIKTVSSLLGHFIIFFSAYRGKNTTLI